MKEVKKVCDGDKLIFRSSLKHPHMPTPLSSKKRRGKKETHWVNWRRKSRKGIAHSTTNVDSQRRELGVSSRKKETRSRCATNDKKNVH